METTNEIKAKVMAPYIGQPTILKNAKTDENLPLTIIRLRHAAEFEMWDSIILILKPLSEITDEHKFMLLPLQGRGVKDIPTNLHFFIDAENFDLCYEFNGEHNDIYEAVSVYSAEKLKDWGYDVPSVHLNGQTLQQAGMAVYKTKTTE